MLPTVLLLQFHSSAHSNYSVDMIDGIIDVGESKEFVIKRKVSHRSLCIICICTHVISCKYAKIKAGKPQPDELAIYYSDATGFDPLKHFVDQPMGEVQYPVRLPGYRTRCSVCRRDGNQAVGRRVTYRTTTMPSRTMSRRSSSFIHTRALCLRSPQL